MTVFVVQRHLVTDRASGFKIDKYDLRDAERFGELRYCIEGDVDVRNTAPLISRLCESLEGYNGGFDYLVLIGNPLLIGLAVAIASDVSESGHVNCLQWTPSERAYLPVTFNLYGEPE